MSPVAETSAPAPGVLDTQAVEVLASTVFRVFFRDGLRIPIQKEGVVDTEIVVRGTDVLVDAHRVEFALPELAVWRFTFAYQGKPVVEYGRGVKHNVKVHYRQAFRLLVASWRLERGRRKAQLLRDRTILTAGRATVAAHSSSEAPSGGGVA